VRIEGAREQRLLHKKTVKEAYDTWYESKADGTWQFKLLNMYSKLVAPIDKHLGNISELYIVPHGPLHHLPFQALVSGLGNIDRTKGVHVPRPRYWIEDMAISYLPSASVLKYAREKGTESDPGALIVGDPVYADLVYRKQPLEGLHSEIVTNAFLNSTPSAASRSMFGVFRKGWPAQPMAS